MGNQDILPKNAFEINFPLRKKEGKNQHTKPQETGKSSSTYAKAARPNTHLQEASWLIGITPATSIVSYPQELSVILLQSP